MGMTAEAVPSGTTLVAETRHLITWLLWNLSFGVLESSTSVVTNP